MEDSLMDLMYKIPSDNTIRKCTITKDAVDRRRSRRSFTENRLLHRRRQPEARRTSRQRKAGNSLMKGQHK